MNKYIFAILFSVLSAVAAAQNPAQPRVSIPRSISADSISYFNPKNYIIGGVKLSGAKYLDTAVLLQISKLEKGGNITLPGDASAKVIKDLWAQGLFDDVKLNITKINLDTIYLEIAIQERPRLSRLHLTGIHKGEIEDLQKMLADKTGKIVNENTLNTITGIIKKNYSEKGFLNATITIKQRPDPGDANNVILDVAIDKKEKVKIAHVYFEGNKA